ncbi:ADP-ribosylhydrolase ARH1-like [Mercenaria mercenaria]|uniref:ADP-ribosylhydrolase ARH1-like n=1 Tax=Mercenaria mercenaria TaxID=6596 RepID=UPI00234E9A39|nr:ADP-ribosylhydrolase ARH1-like [Mercenaria mercenaria]
MAEQLNNLTETKYIAGMVLSGVGDALGYRNGQWEFCSDGDQIHNELYSLGGLNNLKVYPRKWMVSDDTVMHIATAEALIKTGQCTDKLKLYKDIALKYKACMGDMAGRAPGITCKQMCDRLRPSILPEGLKIPFNPRGGGCGAAMRSMCIGLRYPQACHLDDLIAVSIESGRLTHHHPTGYLGSLASALFTSYAVQNKPLIEWGVGLLSTLEKAKIYISCAESTDLLHKDKRTIDQNIKHWDYFKSKWEFYLGLRNIADGQSAPRFAPDEDQVGKRDQFYRMISYDDVGGASGHDAPMIAYDALLACNGLWSELCDRAMFHGGDSDSTGVIAGCLYGVFYGLSGVSTCNYEDLEYFDKLTNIGKDVFILANEVEMKPETLDNGRDTDQQSRKTAESNKTPEVYKNEANTADNQRDNQIKEDTDNSGQKKSEKSFEGPNVNEQPQEKDEIRAVDDIDKGTGQCEFKESDSLTKQSKDIAETKNESKESILPNDMNDKAHILSKSDGLDNTINETDNGDQSFEQLNVNKQPQENEDEMKAADDFDTGSGQCKPNESNYLTRKSKDIADTNAECTGSSLQNDMDDKAHIVSKSDSVNDIVHGTDKGGQSDSVCVDKSNCDVHQSKDQTTESCNNDVSPMDTSQ